MIKGNKAVNIYFVLEVFLSNFIQKQIKDTIDFGEGTPQASSWFRVRKAGPFSIPDQVEVVSSIPGEVVAVDDVLFFLRHTFLVFFSGVGGAGT